MDKTQLIISTILLSSAFWVAGCSVEQHATTFSSTSAFRNGETTRTNRAESIAFINDFDLGLETAKHEAKPVLVFFTHPTCNSSKRMLETTFHDAEVRRLSQRFVCVTVNAAADKELCDKYQIEGFPTLLFTSAQGVEYQRLSGKQTSEQLALQMHVVIQSTAAKSGSAVRK